MSRITDAFAGVWTSLVRTYVPWIVGVIVGWLTTLGVPLDDQLKTSLLTLITLLAGALYYLVARILERWRPQLGWLLGSAQQPVYVKPAAVTAVQDIASAANATEK